MTDTKIPLILIVDDHLPAAEMVNMLFKTHHYRTVCLDNGADALLKAQADQPDLILLDVMMPLMNGFEVLKRLRENPETHNIPTIMVTAKGDPKDIEYGLNLGADDYVTKPIEPRELLARARNKIEAQQLRLALQRRTKDLESLLQVGERLNHTLRIQELQPLIVELLRSQLPATVVAFIRLDSQLHPVDMQTEPTDVEVNIPTNLFALLVEHGSIHWSQGEFALQEALLFGMATAITHTDQLLGVVILNHTKPYDDNHLRLLQGIGRQTALALRNSELYEFQVKYAENLEDLVAERTQALQSTQQMLFRADKLASVGRLAAGFAHEIKNPLFPITLNLQRVLEDMEAHGTPDVEDIQVSLAAVARINGLVERLMQLAKKHPSVSDLEIVYLHRVVESVVALSRTTIRHAQIQIHTHHDLQAVVLGNRDQLEQVFLNLILNAQEAITDHGEITIDTIVAEQEVQVKVRDTGCGIAKDLIERIFEPFYTTKEDGSGLGLFISHEIIRNHNGTLNIESEPGQGTVVTVMLPLAENITTQKLS